MSNLNSWSSNSLNALFGSGSNSNSSTSGLYGLLSERSSIKSGAYKQALKSYYSTAQTSAASSSKSSKSGNVLDQILDSKKNPTVSKKTQEANAALSTNLSSLKTSISALQSDSTYANTDGKQTAAGKVASAMKSFVTEYNNTVKAAKDSNLANKTANVASMMRSTAANADKLAEIGVTVDTDGSLVLDEKKLQAADISKVQDLFSKDSITSYGSTIASRVGYATASSSTSTTAADSVATKQETNNSAAGLKADAKSLASSDLYAKVKDEDGNETDKYDVASILSTAKSFVNNYNNMFDAAKSSTNSGVSANLSRIQQTTARNENALSQLGISVDRNGKLSIDEETFKNSDMSKVQNLFRDYGSSIATSASLVNYYMGTQADASNGYTSSAAYNLQTGATYTTTM